MVQANLVFRPEKLGDLVLATPVFRAFKESYPDQPLHLVTDEIYADAVRRDPHLDKIIPIRWKGREPSRRESWREIYGKLRGTSYQRAALLYYNCEPLNWLMAALRIPHVAQIGGTISAYPLFHRQMRRGGHAQRLHFSKLYLKVAALLGATTRDEAPTLYLDEGEKSALCARFPFMAEPRRRVIVHPFGHGSAPNLALPAYARVMEILSSDPALDIFVTGTAAEREAWKPYEHLHVRTDWLGTLSVREWMAAVSQVDLMIGGATGVTHVAAALQRPTLGLYCPHVGTHPDIWGPLGNSVHLLVVPAGLCRSIQPCESACTASVTCDLSFALRPEAVATKAFALLQESLLSC